MLKLAVSNSENERKRKTCKLTVCILGANILPLVGIGTMYHSLQIWWELVHTSLYIPEALIVKARSPNELRVLLHCLFDGCTKCRAKVSNILAAASMYHYGRNLKMLPKNYEAFFLFEVSKAQLSTMITAFF